MWICHAIRETDWSQAHDDELTKSVVLLVRERGIICLASDYRDIERVEDDVRRLAALGYTLVEREPNHYPAVHTSVVWFRYVLGDGDNGFQGAPVPRPHSPPARSASAVVIPEPGESVGCRDST